MRLLPLVALALLVLIIFIVVRARRLSRAKAAMGEGWYAQKLDIGDATVIKLDRFGYKGRIEARIPHDDPEYSYKVIEEFARVQAKAEDLNSTDKALQA